MLSKLAPVSFSCIWPVSCWCPKHLSAQTVSAQSSLVHLPHSAQTFWQVCGGTWPWHLSKQTFSAHCVFVHLPQVWQTCWQLWAWHVHLSKHTLSVQYALVHFWQVAHTFWQVWGMWPWHLNTHSGLSQSVFLHAWQISHLFWQTCGLGCTQPASIIIVMHSSASMDIQIDFFIVYLWCEMKYDLGCL